MAVSCCFAHRGCLGEGGIGMGRRTKCPHDSDKAPIINAADDCSHRRSENVPAGASGTMPFSAFVSALETSGRVEKVQTGQAYSATLFLFCFSSASGDAIYPQHLNTILVIIQLALTFNTYLVLFGQQPHKPSTSVEKFFMHV